MKLKKLLTGIKVLNAKDIKNVNIENVSNSTNEPLTGGLYVCLKGTKVDGHTLKEEAKKKGAIAFLVEELDVNFDGEQILVEDTRSALSLLARNFYFSKKLPKIIGITGTNGKTTTTSMVAHVLNSASKKAGLIGTEGIFYDEKRINLHMTTPDPLQLFKHLNEMAKAGVKYAVMEVSAHAIYLKKVQALNFKVKAITNITEEHLDFFTTMDKYATCKLDFIKEGKGVKIINIDDKYCNTLAGEKDILTYSNKFPARAMAINLSGDGRDFEALLFGRRVAVHTNLIGYYNVQNTLCAMLICKKLGLKTEQILEGLKTFKSVDGRLNIYEKDGKFAIVDFAHTPDALEKILNVAKNSYSGKVICIFGCGGNRDATKRPVMGQIASDNSSYVIISNDNPRYEDENEIAKEIASGIKTNNYEIICDREKAILKASNMLSDGDVLVLAGKGAEDYIEVKGEKIPYSDAGVLTALGFKRI